MGSIYSWSDFWRWFRSVYFCLFGSCIRCCFSTFQRKLAASGFTYLSIWKRTLYYYRCRRQLYKSGAKLLELVWRIQNNHLYQTDLRIFCDIGWRVLYLYIILTSLRRIPEPKNSLQVFPTGFMLQSSCSLQEPEIWWITCLLLKTGKHFLKNR